MVNTMENAEEVMQILDRFTRLKQKEIPKELDDYLQYVAKTGDTVFKWSSLKYLFREKLLNVIKHFHDTTPRVDEIPQYPNVDPFNYESMKSSLLERLEHFNAAPFTIQRLCELLIDPRKQYSRIDKFMRALEKNILVVSTVEPGRKRTDSENGDSLDSVVNGDLSLDVNVDIEMDNEALFAIEGQNGNGVVPAAAAVVEAALNDCKDKSSAAVSIMAVDNSNASRSGDDDILPHPKKAKLELNDKEKKSEEVEQSVTKELNNGNEIAEAVLVADKVVEEKKVEENGNTESEKPIDDTVEKQNDVEMAEKLEVKKEEKVEEEKKEEMVTETAKTVVETVKEIPASEEVAKEVEKSNEKKALIVEKELVAVQEVDILKHTKEEMKVTVEKKEQEIKEVTIETAASEKIVENIESVQEKATTVEAAPETTTKAATTTVEVEQETAAHKKCENEQEIDKEPAAVSCCEKSQKTEETPTVAVVVVVETVEKSTNEPIIEKVPEKLVETVLVEEKVLDKEDTSIIANKSAAETEKEQLIASTETAPTPATATAEKEAAAVTEAVEQKTKEIAEKVETAETTAKPVEIVTEVAAIVAEEVEENMQIPIETDTSPLAAPAAVAVAAAGIDIDEMPSAELAVAVPTTIATVLTEASSAPAISLNDQPMEDLPMEESAPEEVIMAETVATGNSGLIEMSTDAMEASGKQELPVDGMDVDDTSQEAMDQ